MTWFVINRGRLLKNKYITPISKGFHTLTTYITWIGAHKKVFRFFLWDGPKPMAGIDILNC